MKTTNNTILVTGGSAGIGFEIAKQLSAKGNHVIITGRSKERLQQAVAKLSNTTGIVSDVTNEADVEQLVSRLNKDFPSLNVVINNAGHAILYDLVKENVNAFEKAQEEMFTNYLSVIRLTEKLLPLLKQQTAAAIVNVSSIVAFVPGSLTTYSASKAALHSYTQSLRLHLEDAFPAIKVFELMPPLVDTEFSAPINGKSGIHPSIVAEDLLKAFEKDEYEIHVGKTADIYQLFRTSPAEALRVMHGSRQPASINN
jgi:uncharacterized oxidoreductase